MYAAFSSDNGLLKAAHAASTLHVSSSRPGVLQFAAQVSGAFVPHARVNCHNRRDNSECECWKVRGRGKCMEIEHDGNTFCKMCFCSPAPGWLSS
jgi:hypothetical protein